MEQYFTELNLDESRNFFGGGEYEWIYVEGRYIRVPVHS